MGPLPLALWWLLLGSLALGLSLYRLRRKRVRVQALDAGASDPDLALQDPSAPNDRAPNDPAASEQPDAANPPPGPHGAAESAREATEATESAALETMFDLPQDDTVELPQSRIDTPAEPNAAARPSPGSGADQTESVVEPMMQPVPLPPPHRPVGEADSVLAVRSPQPPR